MAHIAKFDIFMEYDIAGVSICNTTEYGELREDNDFKQQYIASILNIDRTTYSKYELGSLEPPIPILKELAKFYNTSVDYLVR